MKKLIMLTVVIGTFFALAGCGQKGALFIPDNPDRTPKEKLDEFYKRY